MDAKQESGKGRRLPMLAALAVSLLLHALPVGAWLALTTLPRTAPPRETVLAMENIGILSDSNHEAVAAPAAPPPPPVAAPPKPAPSPSKPLPKRKSPVRVREEKQAAPPAPAAAAAPAVAAEHVSDDGETREAQHSAEAERQRITEEYKRILLKHIDRFLRYPIASELAGETGYPTVAFTLTVEGRILPGSLRVTKSSGFPALDEASLAAIRQGASFFPKPPRQIRLEYGFSFDKRGAQGGSG
ncbi:MAG: TonB family protein [Azoarcus sp.]|jgi:protein TonB|nr:TonB family protein [Azoarcus sp.]